MWSVARATEDSAASALGPTATPDTTPSPRPKVSSLPVRIWSSWLQQQNLQPPHCQLPELDIT